MSDKENVSWGEVARRLTLKCCVGYFIGNAGIGGISATWNYNSPCGTHPPKSVIIDGLIPSILPKDGRYDRATIFNRLGAASALVALSVFGPGDLGGGNIGDGLRDWKRSCPNSPWRPKNLAEVPTGQELSRK